MRAPARNPGWVWPGCMCAAEARACSAPGLAGSEETRPHRAAGLDLGARCAAQKRTHLHSTLFATESQMPPNGLELSCPAARATVHQFSRILAGKAPANFPHASRVSCSELLCGLHRQAVGRRATVHHPQTPPAAHSRSPPPDFASTASCPTSRLATPAPLRRSKACELDLAGYGSLSRMMPWLAGTPSPQSLAPAPAPGRDTRCSWLCLHR